MKEYLFDKVRELQSEFIETEKVKSIGKEIFVWSSGSKNCINHIVTLIMNIILFILLIVLLVTVLNVNKSVKTDLFTIFLGFFLFISAILLKIVSSIEYICTNEFIPLYLYDIDEFATIGKIPENMYVLFSDKNGVVLALKEYSISNGIFAADNRHYSNYVEIYNSLNKNK